VPFHCVDADNKLDGDLVVRVTRGQELENLGLASRQAIWPAGRRPGSRPGDRHWPACEALSLRQEPGEDASVGTRTDDVPCLAGICLRVVPAPGAGLDPGQAKQRGRDLKPRLTAP
jgi:hypothetical protein